MFAKTPTCVWTKPQFCVTLTLQDADSPVVSRYKDLCLTPVVCTCGQIAPAEGMDPKQRMVIIAGPPEAQFKVKFLQTVGKMESKSRLACFTGQFASLLGRKRRLVPAMQPE